ncbi:MAG: hypothetical protein VB106_15120 [Clostridiaceae bacterium]|nr:hypothetical protein [Clostridiaceae bacterium]
MIDGVEHRSQQRPAFYAVGVQPNAMLAPPNGRVFILCIGLTSCMTMNRNLK